MGAALAQPFWQTDADAVRLRRDLNLAFVPVRENFRAALAAQERLDKICAKDGLVADDLLKSAWLHDLRGDQEQARGLYTAYLQKKPSDPAREAIVQNRLAGGPRPFFVHILCKGPFVGFHNLVLGEGVPEAQIPPIRVFTNQLVQLTPSDNVSLEGLGSFNGHYRSYFFPLKFKSPELEKQQHRYRFTVAYESYDDTTGIPVQFGDERVDYPFHSFLFISQKQATAGAFADEHPRSAWASTPFGHFWMVPIFGWDSPTLSRGPHRWPAPELAAPQLNAEAVYKLFEGALDGAPGWPESMLKSQPPVRPVIHRRRARGKLKLLRGAMIP